MMAVVKQGPASQWEKLSFQYLFRPWSKQNLNQNTKSAKLKCRIPACTFICFIISLSSLSMMSSSMLHSSIWIETKKNFVLINGMFQSIKTPLLLDREMLFNSSRRNNIFKTHTYSAAEVHPQVGSISDLKIYG